MLAFITMNIPNILTLLRVGMVPLVIIAMYLPISFASLLAAGIFALACLTDLLDGYLARMLKQESKFGAFLDPVADKLMVAAVLVVLAQSEASIYFTVPAIVIISREILISALREWMAELGKRRNIAVSQIAKVKTSSQMLAIFLFLGQFSYMGYSSKLLAYTALYVSATLTLISMLLYLRAAWSDLKMDA